MSLPQPFESMAAVMSLVWSSFFFGMPGSYDSQKKPVDTDAMIIMIAFLAFKVHIQTSLSQVPAMFFFDVMCGCGFDTRVLSQLLGSEFWPPWLEKPLPSEFSMVKYAPTFTQLFWKKSLNKKKELCDHLGHLNPTPLHFVSLFFNWICAGLPWSWNHYATHVSMDWKCWTSFRSGQNREVKPIGMWKSRHFFFLLLFFCFLRVFYCRFFGGCISSDSWGNEMEPGVVVWELHIEDLSRMTPFKMGISMT